MMKCHHGMVDPGTTDDVKRLVGDENGERKKGQEIVMMGAKWRWGMGTGNHATEKRTREDLVLDKGSVVGIMNGFSVGMSGVDESEMEMIFSWTTGGFQLVLWKVFINVVDSLTSPHSSSSLNFQSSQEKVREGEVYQSDFLFMHLILSI